MPVVEQENPETSAELYDVSTDEAIAIESVELPAMASPDPLGDGATGYTLTENETSGAEFFEYEQVEYLDIQHEPDVKDEPFNLAMLETSLDNILDDSDCEVTGAYYINYENDDNIVDTADTE